MHSSTRLRLLRPIFWPLLCRSAALLPLSLLTTALYAQQTPFTPGDLVVAVEGCGVYGGTCTVPNGTGTGSGNSNAGGYGDNQATPLTLFQFAPIGTTAVTYVNSLVLPQTAAGLNFPVSGEYGSSSEATLQLSGNGQYLTILGYGVNATAFDANPAQYGAAPSLALGQSQSLTGASTTAVPRVLALIDASGNVSSSTAVYNVFNANNPRSGFTADGTSLYLSGQGTSGDTTGGVFFTRIGAPNTAPTPITGLDTSNNTASQDTRTVEIVNNTLYVSVDSKAGSNAARDFIGTLGTPGTLPTTTVGAPTMLNGFGNSGGTGKVSITTNGNSFNAGQQINISPVNFFFASPSILYVADSGTPKNNSATSSLGDGGLQKWINTAADGSGTWNLAYTLYQGLNLVKNSNTSGTSGLFGLTGQVTNGQVRLYATNYTLTDLDPTFLFGVTDILSYTTPTQAAAETFTQLSAAPKGSNYKGVSFAPTAPASTALLESSNITFANGSYQVALTVKNSGAATAQNIVLNSLALGSAGAASLPVTLGPLAAGASVTTSFTVPFSAGAHGAVVAEKAAGTLTGGSFSAALRVVLP